MPYNSLEMRFAIACLALQHCGEPDPQIARITPAQPLLLDCFNLVLPQISSLVLYYSNLVLSQIRIT